MQEPSDTAGCITCQSFQPSIDWFFAVDLKNPLREKLEDVN